MLFLFGEKIRTSASSLGEKPCVLCGLNRPFSEFDEANWFCLFGFPLAKLESTAHYWQCETCLTSYEPARLEVPSAIPVLKKLVVYILLGYEQAAHVSLASDICVKLTNIEFEDQQVRQLVQSLCTQQSDLVNEVRSAAANINLQGKQQIIAAAFLATHACCELQYEDRLRINLMGNALNVGLEFVEHVIEDVRRHNYYGVGRLSQTSPTGQV